MAKDVCFQTVAPCPMEDTGENVGEAKRIRYCRKISKPSESGLQETPCELRGHIAPKYDLPGESKGKNRGEGLVEGTNCTLTNADQRSLLSMG